MKLLFPLLLWFAAVMPAEAAFDQRHTAWDALLKKHVVLVNEGSASQVRYAAFKQDQPALKRYLDSVSAVPEAEFNGWSKPLRLAFLINAYNAFTVQLILSQYPEVKSIKDLGSFATSPWKKKFFTLFGNEQTLDHIEHDLIRAPSVYDDPRIHVAVVCASIGCPALRNEAYVGEQLDAQLDDGLRRFLSDRSRNRFNAEKQVLEVSKLFDWYRKDFEKGNKGFSQLEDVFAAHAELLANGPADRELIRAKKASIKFLDYDWRLNDARR